MKNRRRKKFIPYLKLILVKFSRITEFVVFREGLISGISYCKIFSVDLISRILVEFGKTAKFNPREN